MKIKKSEIDKIISKKVNESIGQDDINFIQSLELKLKNINDNSADIIQNNEYSLQYCYSIIKETESICKSINDNIFKEDKILSNISIDKIFYLLNLRNLLEKISISNRVISSRIGEKFRMKNKTFKQNTHNEKMMKMENSIEKIYKELDDKCINPIKHKLDNLIKELEKTYTTISKNL